MTIGTNAQVWSGLAKLNDALGPLCSVLTSAFWSTGDDEPELPAWSRTAVLKQVDLTSSALGRLAILMLNSIRRPDDGAPPPFEATVRDTGPSDNEDLRRWQRLDGTLQFFTFACRAYGSGLLLAGADPAEDDALTPKSLYRLIVTQLDVTVEAVEWLYLLIQDVQLAPRPRRIENWTSPPPTWRVRPKPGEPDASQPPGR